MGASSSGYVYVVEGAGLYKIGSSAHAARRLSALRSSSPVAIKEVAVLETDDRFALEAAIQARFSEQRHRGEWFRLDNADVSWIKALTCQARKQLIKQIVAPAAIVAAVPSKYQGAMVFSIEQVAGNAGVTTQAVSIALNGGRLTAKAVIGRRGVLMDGKYYAFLTATRNRLSARKRTNGKKGKK